MFKKIKISISLILVLFLILGALAWYDIKGGAEVRIFEKLGINLKISPKITNFFASV